MKSYPLVEVLWTDAVEAAPEWVEIKDLPNKTMPTKSVGYIIKESKEAVTLAALQNKTHVALTLTIPRRMIDKITPLVPGA